MYPGKFLSLANKGWDWAPLLKHVGFWVKKKVSYMLKKRETELQEKLKNFWSIKVKVWSSKIKNSEEIQKLKIPKN